MHQKYIQVIILVKQLCFANKKKKKKKKKKKLG